ncbi:MFS quinate transporter QutD [Thozetella sp. PMI_491]|nr:MFS quinate transporter QutD [Thozetella sp. PMI_491]
MGNPFKIKEDPNRPVPREAYGWRVYAIAASAAMASAMFGYDSAFIGGSLSLPSFKKSFGLDSAAATALSSNIVGTFQAGCFFGSLFGFPISENFGRRINLIVSGIVFIIGAVIQTVSNGNLGMMYAGRACTGLGVGSSAMIVPVYIAESSPPTIRGRLIGVFEVALQIASVCGFWVNYGVQQNLPSDVRQWQIPFVIQIIPAGLLIGSMLWTIESPRWLIKQGKHEQALKNLAWVRNLPQDHQYVQSEIAEMRAQIDHEAEFNQGGGTWAAAWKELTAKGMRGRVVLAVAMKFMQNFAGVNALNYYSPMIFQSIGFTGTSTGLLATGVYGIIKAVVTLVFITWFVDTWGRRPALFVGGMISCFAMLFLGTYSAIAGSFTHTPPKDAGAYFAIIMIYIYAAAYAFSWNAMPWIFAAEIFPTKIRGLAMLITVLAQWLSQFIVIYATPYMIANITYGTFFFFGACILISSGVVYCFIPETKGFPLEKMHLLFAGSIWAPTARREAERMLAEDDAAEAAANVVSGLKASSEIEHQERV